MLAPRLPSRAKRIAHIQRHTDEVVRLAAVGIGMIGGDDAVDEYLHHTLAHLLGVAIAKQGQERACALAGVGLVIAETYPELPGC